MARRGRPRKVIKSFDDMKDEVLEKVILHMRYPEQFSAPVLTYEEIALLFAKDQHDLKTKMCICKWEQKALQKLRAPLEKSGIRSINDIKNSDNCRSYAMLKGATDRPE